MSFTGRILLDNNEERFFTGDTIKGSIEIDSQENTFVEDISIFLEGVTQIKWEDLDQKSKHGEIVYFMQNFESKEYCVRQQMRLQQNPYLQRGVNSFQFSCCIPEELPSSLTTTTGFRRYELVLILRNSTDCHKLQDLIIYIQKYFDICRNSRCLKPFTDDYTKYCYWWPCKAKPIFVSVTLPSTAFIPGDFVKYLLAIENHTRHFDIKRVSAFIIQTLHYKSLKPKIRIKTEMKTLNYRTHLQPCPRDSKSCIDNVFKLPSNLVATCGEKSVLKVGYRFQVLIIMKGLHMDGSIIIPITIGSHRVTSQIAATGTGSGDFIAKEYNSITIDDLPVKDFDSFPNDDPLPGQSIETIV